MIRRRLLTFLSALSLILCVGTVGLWVRGKSVRDEVYLPTTASTMWAFHSGFGSLGVGHFDHWPPPTRFFHKANDLDRRHETTPFLAIGRPYFRSTKWQTGEFYFSRGTVCVVLKQDRTVDYGSPVLSILGTAKLSQPLSFWTFSIPSWSLLVLLALFPMVQAGHFIIRRSVRGLRAWRRLCPACGYDLRATPELCPECGTVTAQEARTTA